jgi:DNA-directed RNA polymerase specialized sigma24 family protein
MSITAKQYKLLQGICRKNWSGRSDDLEDYTADVVCDVLKHWHKYDSNKGAFSTWCWYRSMKIRNRWKRKVGRNPLTHGVPIDDVEFKAKIGSPDEVMARAELSHLFRGAPPIVKEAIEAQALGLSASETREALGISGQSRAQRINRYMRSLAKRLEE